jgi:uroporphyrinogen-III synthase
MRLLLTRPLADSLPLAAMLEAGGHSVLVAPLMEITEVDGALIDLDGVQALLATSSNAVRAIAGGEAEHTLAARDLPLFAVGDATARTAREFGFPIVHTAGGDVGKLAELVLQHLSPKDGRLVHIAGRERAGDLKGALERHGFTVDIVVLYRAEAAGALNDEAIATLSAGDIDAVLLYSPRTAAIWARLITQHGLAERVRRVAHLCLSRAVAEALAPLGLADGAVRIADEPRQRDLLRLIETKARSKG